jgi:hypothetical protein
MKGMSIPCFYLVSALTTHIIKVRPQLHEMKHFIVLPDNFSFKYFTLPDDGFFFKSKTCCNILHSKLIQTIAVNGCCYFSIVTHILQYKDQPVNALWGNNH